VGQNGCLVAKGCILLAMTGSGKSMAAIINNQQVCRQKLIRYARKWAAEKREGILGGLGKF
jgi:hypothetical protein